MYPQSHADNLFCTNGDSSDLLVCLIRILPLRLRRSSVFFRLRIAVEEAAELKVKLFFFLFLLTEKTQHLFQCFNVELPQGPCALYGVTPL